MSWALELKKDILKYLQNLEALQKHDAELKRTAEIISKACAAAANITDSEIEKLQNQIEQLKADMVSGVGITQLNEQLETLQKEYDATKVLSAEEKNLEGRISDCETHSEVMIGKKLRYERLIAENKWKFWKSSAEYKAELAKAEQSLLETQSKIEKLKGELSSRREEFSRNRTKAYQLLEKIKEVKAQIEEMIQKKEEEISALSSQKYNFIFDERSLKKYFTEDEKKFVEKSLLLLLSVDLQLAHENYPELTQALSLLIDYRNSDYDDCQEGSLWDDGDISFLCKEKCEEIFQLLDEDEDGKYRISCYEATTCPDEIYLENIYDISLTKDGLILSEEFIEEKEDEEEREPSEDDDIEIELPDITYGLNFSKSVFKKALGTREELSLNSTMVLKEWILNALLQEIARDENVNLPTLILNIWDGECKGEFKVSKPILGLVKQLKRLFELSPEQVLIEEQRYYKQKEIEQLEENAWLEREQRDEHARLEREEIEYQAERDRRQREREERRRQEREEEYYEEQIRIQKENARAEQRRWEEDKRREDEMRERERRDAEDRRKREEHEHWKQTMKEEQEKRDMLRLCRRCANYGKGCHGGIVRCGNFRSK